MSGDEPQAPASVRIRLREAGPYVVEGEVEIVDWNGTVCTTTRRPVALCRCGASRTKPFCDGSHRHGAGTSDASRQRS